MAQKSWERLIAHLLAVPEGDYETYRADVGWDNHTRFGKQYGADGVAWCVIFDWCMYDDVGLAGIVPKTWNVTDFSQWAKARGQWSEYPSVGAWVNFGNGDHTEIVTHFDDTYVYTKGGNTVPSGSTDGGQGRGVYSHKTARRIARVTGYFAPKFPDGCPPTADPNDYRKSLTPTPEPEPPTPAPVRNNGMALVSKTVPAVVGDDSATTFTAVPGRAWINVSADYVPPGEKLTARIDVSDGAGGWLKNNEIRRVANGEAGWFELPGSERTRMVSVKRLSHDRAKLDATLHYPEG